LFYASAAGGFKLQSALIKPKCAPQCLAARSRLGSARAFACGGGRPRPPLGARPRACFGAQRRELIRGNLSPHGRAGGGFGWQTVWPPKPPRVFMAHGTKWSQTAAGPDISHPIPTDSMASRRSAGFQPAGSPISNRQGVESQPRLSLRARRRLEARRYSGLEIRATSV
jgi:hypothetical protein